MSNEMPCHGAEGDEMRQTIARHSRADLEHLLDGQPPRHDALAQLLTAALPSPDVVDIAGMDAALAAFTGVSLVPPFPAERSPSMMKTLAAKAMAAKLAIVGGVAAAASVGGVAFAASTGHLPSPLPHSTHAAPSASAHVPANGTESAATSGSASSKPHPSTTPSPSLVGLCHSWLARPHTNGSADTNPAFTVLVTAAGGTASVNSYCTALLASSTPTASTEPGNADHPTGKPSDVPSNTDHPTGKPSDVPSNTDHPTGKPSNAPGNPSHPTGKPSPSH
jgi:hypothetical protein